MLPQKMEREDPLQTTCFPTKAEKNLYKPHKGSPKKWTRKTLYKPNQNPILVSISTCAVDPCSPRSPIAAQRTLGWDRRRWRAWHCGTRAWYWWKAGTGKDSEPQNPRKQNDGIPYMLSQACAKRKRALQGHLELLICKLRLKKTSQI